MLDSLRRAAKKYPVIRTVLWAPIAAKAAYLRSRERPANQIISWLETHVVGDVIVRLEEFDAEFYLPATSRLFQRAAKYGHYEPEWAAMFLSHVEAGSHVIDVGANVGFYAVAAAKKGARVLAIEPTTGAFERLQKNVVHNRVADRVLAFNGLASDANAMAEMHVVEGLEEYSSMAPIYAPYIEGHQAQVTRVESRTIDSLVVEHGLSPRVIKVDVEGAEMQVFRGAAETLAAHRPVVMSELSDKLLARFGNSGDEVVSLFRERGYDVLSADGAPLVDRGDSFGEILCIPRSS